MEFAAAGSNLAQPWLLSSTSSLVCLISSQIMTTLKCILPSIWEPFHWTRCPPWSKRTLAHLPETQRPWECFARMRTLTTR